MNFPGYDAWLFSRATGDRIEVGTEEGQTCNRLPEPDEARGRARPIRCTGTMVQVEAGVTLCDTCNEEAS